MSSRRRLFNKLTPVPFQQVEITDKFWANRQKINREVSIHYQHQKLEENQGKDVAVYFMQVKSKMLSWGDIRSSPEHWINRCMSQYYGTASIKPLP